MSKNNKRPKFSHQTELKYFTRKLQNITLETKSSELKFQFSKSILEDDDEIGAGMQVGPAFNQRIGNRIHVRSLRYVIGIRTYPAPTTAMAIEAHPYLSAPSGDTDPIAPLPILSDTTKTGLVMGNGRVSFVFDQGGKEAPKFADIYDQIGDTDPSDTSPHAGNEITIGGLLMPNVGNAARFDILKQERWGPLTRPFNVEPYWIPVAYKVNYPASADGTYDAFHQTHSKGFLTYKSVATGNPGYQVLEGYLPLDLQMNLGAPAGSNRLLFTVCCQNEGVPHFKQDYIVDAMIRVAYTDQ